MYKEAHSQGRGYAPESQQAKIAKSRIPASQPFSFCGLLIKMEGMEPDQGLARPMLVELDDQPPPEDKEELQHQGEGLARNDSWGREAGSSEGTEETPRPIIPPSTDWEMIKDAMDEHSMDWHRLKYIPPGLLRFTADFVMHGGKYIPTYENYLMGRKEGLEEGDKFAGPLMVSFRIVDAEPLVLVIEDRPRWITIEEALDMDDVQVVFEVIRKGLIFQNPIWWFVQDWLDVIEPRYVIPERLNSMH